MRERLIIAVFVLTMSLLLVFTISCDKENPKSYATITTVEVDNIGQNSAYSGGNITDDGGSIVTARGVCWSTETTPSISDNKTLDGTGSGSFTSYISDLEPSTTYHIRAYATTKEGTGYGCTYSFKTLESELQHLENEKKAIERFIIANNIKVLKKYPQNSTFKPNEFYFDSSSGVYYNVIDSGLGRKIKNGEEVYIRFKGLKYIESSDTTTYSNFNDLQPGILVFGNSATYSSTAWVVPLKNVGDRAIVRMIVPFNMGFPNDQHKYKTAYYEELIYRFEM